MEVVDTGGAFVSDTGCTFVWDDMSEGSHVDLGGLKGGFLDWFLFYLGGLRETCWRDR